MNKIIYFFKKIPHRVWLSATIIRTFKNWWIWPQNRYNLFHHYNKGDEVILHLRNGIKFYFKFGHEELGVLTVLWCQKIYTRYWQIKEGDIVIDIGAHIGAFSIFAATTAKRIKVFCYEPSPKTFPTLVKNIKINNLENVIFPFQLGVAKRSGERMLFFHPCGDFGDTLYKDNLFVDKNNSACIKTITLKDIFERNNLDHCDFLKMNCESAEYEILLNIPLEYLQKIRYLVFAYHHGCRKIVNFLEKNNFSIRLNPISEAQGLIYAKHI